MTLKPNWLRRRRTLSEIVVNGTRLWADASGAIWWPESETLAVADLHMEKASAFARHGSLLPPYDTRKTLAKIRDLVERYRPVRLLSLGDSFHDSEGPARLDEGEAQTLAELGRQLELVWVVGNHDPSLPSYLPGRQVSVWTLDALVFRHEPSAAIVSGEVFGHYHPKARIDAGGRHLVRRCFVSDGQRLLLPSFGALTGGLDVQDVAIHRHFPAGFSTWLVGETRIIRVPMQRLIGRT
jgi:DNA ligase-associated metallophosphoesterase